MNLALNTFRCLIAKKDVARDFISYLIDFVSTKISEQEILCLMLQIDIGRYLYSCLENRKCAICNDTR